MQPQLAHFYRWNDIPAETLKGTITRKFVSSDRPMIAPLALKKGDDVPRHAHENEQSTYLPSGSMDLAVFNPPRQNWLQGTDAYLRR